MPSNGFSLSDVNVLPSKGTYQSPPPPLPPLPIHWLMDCPRPSHSMISSLSFLFLTWFILLSVSNLFSVSLQFTHSLTLLCLIPEITYFTALCYLWKRTPRVSESFCLIGIGQWYCYLMVWFDKPISLGTNNEMFANCELRTWDLLFPIDRSISLVNFSLEIQFPPFHFSMHSTLSSIAFTYAFTITLLVQTYGMIRLL